MKRLGKALLAVAALVLVYLAIAAGWAAASVDPLLARHPATQSSLSPSQLAILLKIEDPTFLTHHGLSLADGQGVATISSAVARDVFLYGAALPSMKGVLQRVYRAVFDCCRKIDLGRDVMALVLDASASKQRQLDLYVGGVYMGRHEGRQVRGLEAAAQAYLGKPLAAVDEDGMARLVAMVKAPNELHPVRNRDAFELRLARVRAVLAGHCQPKGWLDTSYVQCDP